MVSLEEPDKGFAWVVAFCACVINMIVSGLSRMIGLLYVALIEEYGVSRKEASTPFTVRNAVRYFTGPLAGVLGQTYGIRAVTLWGGLITAIGSILCAAAPTVGWIVFFWGCVHGLGYSLANTLFQVVINQWFEKHRATASGLVLSGSCICSIFYPVMIQSILDAYGVSGCFLLLGGIFLNTLPPALLMKAPSWIEHPKAYAKQRSVLSNPCHEDLKMCKSPIQFHPNENEGGNSIPALWVNIGQATHLSGSKIPPRALTYFPAEKQRHLFFGTKTEGVFHKQSVICTLYQPAEISYWPCFEEDPKLQNGIYNPAFVEEISASRIMLKSSTNKLSTGSSESNSSKNTPPAKKGFFQNARNIPRLYMNPVYNLISISVASYMWMFLPLLTVIVDYTRDKGIPEKYEQFLIHSMTFGDLIGRLAFGWVTDKKFMTLSTFTMLSFLVQGIFSALIPLSNSLIICMIAVGFTGMASGVIFAHFPIMVHEYVEEENQSIAIGCIGMFSSIATFGIPPVIGYFRDHVGCYDGLFYIIGIISVATSFLWLLVSFCKSCHAPS